MAAPQRRDDAATPQGESIFRTIYDGKASNRDYLEQAMRETREKAASWRRLGQVYRPEVGALTFYAVDATSHRFWHLAFPDDPTDVAGGQEDERMAIFDAVRGVDWAIGEILESYGPDDTIIVLFVLDVAPLVLYAAGSPIPDDLEVRLPIEHLDPAALAARPPRFVDASTLPGLPTHESAGVVPADPALTDRLRALGYLAD